MLCLDFQIPQNTHQLAVKDEIILLNVLMEDDKNIFLFQRVIENFNKPIILFSG